MSSPARFATLLAAVCAGAVTLYLAGGAAGAYLAADDFQWLGARWWVDWPRLFDPQQYHFFRPVVQLWFAGGTSVCGPSETCYHGLSLGLHALNVGLVGLTAQALTGRRGFALLCALLFAVQPAYTQAVVWISAVTALLATTCVLTSVFCAARSWQSPNLRHAWEAAAVIAGACAMFAHEVGVTTPLLVLLAALAFKPAGRPRSTVLWAGFAGALLLFAASSYAISRKNSVLSQGSYRLGTHMLRHALDYAVTLWIGPHRLLAYVATVVAAVAVAAGNRLARAGLIAMLLTMVPYLGFTWANVSRYTYLPAIGFSWMVAALLLTLYGWLAARPGWARRAAAVTAVLLLALVFRFGSFAVRGAGGEVFRIDAYRQYARAVMAQHPQPPDELHVPPPASPYMDAAYVEGLLQWAYGRRTLRVIVDPR